MMFMMQEPFYGIVLSSMDRLPTRDITDTLAVGKSGNVFKLYYNEDFVKTLSVDTTLQLLKHECLHLAFNHFSIWGDEERFDTPEMHNLRNIAEDLEVNCYLDRDKVQKDVGGCWAEDLGYQKYEGTRTYFSKLLNMQQPQPQQNQASSPQQPCNGGQGGDNSQQTQNQNNQQQQNQQSSPQGGQPTQQQLKDTISKLGDKPTFDDHTQWPKNVSNEEVEQLQQTIDDLLVFAAEEVEKSCGSIPAELKGRITDLRKKKPRPAADWKRYFRRYLGNEFTEFIRKSKKRESRRFPDAAGNRHRRKSHILIGIDTSGSVSLPELREFFGQIKTLTAVADFHVIECDARIQYEYDYKGKLSETLHGGGGTDFQPVVDVYNNNTRKYDALVYFTDGYCYIPKDTPKDTLWVISSKGDQSDRKKYRVNGASVVFIPKKEQ